MLEKMKITEQHTKNMQGLGENKSVAFKDLCMFPNVHLPPGFKTRKFDKYDGHDDPIAHLKRYCNQLRGAGGKEELLMAYFCESLTGVTSEWLIDKEISHGKYGMIWLKILLDNFSIMSTLCQNVIHSPIQEKNQVKASENMLSNGGNKQPELSPH